MLPFSHREQALLHQARGAWKIFRRSLTLVVAVERCEIPAFHLAHEYLLQVWLPCSSRRGRVASKRGHNGGCEKFRHGSRRLKLAELGRSATSSCLPMRCLGEAQKSRCAWGMRVLPGGGCTIPQFRFSMTKQWPPAFRTAAFPMFGGSIEPGALPLASMMPPNNAIRGDRPRTVGGCL